MARLTPPKSPMVYDKHHSGCMWGLYGLFEFGQGNSTRKLLSDRKRVRRETSDDGDVRRCELIAELDAKCGGKDVKNVTSGNSDTQNAKVETKEMKSTHSVESIGKARKPSQHPSPVALQGQSDSEKRKGLPQKNPKKNHVKKKRGCGCKNVDFVNYDKLLKVNDVAEEIVNQKLIEGKYLSRLDGVNKQSKQLLDALEILNSNKDLFAKLLQDPNSLLVKHIQDLRESQEQKQRSVDSERNGDDQIVVLKPGMMSSLDSLRKTGFGFDEHGQSVRPTYFSFNDIKKRFKHAMGVSRKDQSLMAIDGAKTGVSPGEKIRGAKEVRRNFQNTKLTGISSFDAQKRDKIEKLREFKARIGQESASSSDSRTYMENIRRQYSETMISSPECERDVKTTLAASQMRYSPYSYNQGPHDRRRLVREQKALKQNVEHSINSEKPDTKARVSDADSSSRTAALEANRDALAQEEAAASSERLSGSNGSIETSSEDTKRANDEFECSATDSSVELSSSDDVSLTPPSTTDSSKDVGESSPISVLEQYFAEVSSPPSQSTDPKHLLDHNADTKTSTISDYVETVLRLSRLNPGDPISECLELVTCQASQFCGDCKLLLDCISEVLVELHAAHLRPAHWLTFFEPASLRHLQPERFVTQEATKRITGGFFGTPAVQWPLDRLIGDDLRRADTWLDIRADGEDVVFEVVGAVLEELVVESMVELCI